MTVWVQQRPWANSVTKVDGEAGHLYDITLIANDRVFDYPRLLEATKHLHPHFVHILLDSFEGTVGLTLPTILGSAKVISLLDEFLTLAVYAVGRGRSPISPQPNALAEEWTEYVLAPTNPLAFLAPGMPCSFFAV